MLDNLLSTWGKRSAIAVVVVCSIYATWAAITRTGLARPIILFQLRSLGFDSMKVTAVLLIVPSILGGYVLGFLFDLVTRQGIFASGTGDGWGEGFDPASFGQVRKVRIVAVPPGEAPEAIRNAWVGLELPIDGGKPGPQTALTHGVLTGPKTIAGQVFRALNGQAEQQRGYIIDASSALEILGLHAPDAARWWAENSPQSCKPGRKFLFAAEVCKEVV